MNSQMIGLLLGVLLRHLLGAPLLVDEDDDAEYEYLGADTQERPQRRVLVYSEQCDIAKGGRGISTAAY